MELRIKSYSQDGENIFFECAYGGKEFSAEVNPNDKYLKHDEYDATAKEKDRIGAILINKAEKLMGSQ